MHLACLPVRFSSYHPRMYAKFSLFIGRLLLTSSGNCKNLQQLPSHQQAQIDQHHSGKVIRPMHPDHFVAE